MEEFKVSCIIPAYNAEKSLPELLESVEAQNYENLEIVVVNDGSTDGTWDVIQEWVKKDPRIVPVNKENGGVGSARNAGLDVATGDFICFFDADDYVYPRAIERYVKRMSQEPVIMAIGKIQVVHMNERHVIKATERLGDNHNIRKYTKSLNWSLSLCNKCFRRDLIEKDHLRFNDTRHGEDAVFVMTYVHSNEGKIRGIPSLVYRYVKKSFADEMSLSKRIDVGAIESIKSNMAEIIRIVDKSIEADRAYYAETTELTPEQIATKLDNIESYRSNLFRRFVNSTVLNVYYRYIWNTEDGVFPILKDLYKEYMSNMLEEDKETVYTQHEDLRLRDGMMDKEALAADPILTVAVSDVLPADKAAKLVSGYYNQSFPAFELVVSKAAAAEVPEVLSERKNYHVIDASGDSFKKAALNAAKGKYIIFTDDFLVPSTSTILEMTQFIKEKKCSFVSGVIKYWDENEKKLSSLLTYSMLSGEKEKGRMTDKDLELCDSTVWGNKIFVADALRKSDAFSRRSGKKDCLRKLMKELSHEFYPGNVFISDFSGMTLDKRLGILDKAMILAKKVSSNKQSEK